MSPMKTGLIRRVAGTTLPARTIASSSVSFGARLTTYTAPAPPTTRLLGAASFHSSRMSMEPTVSKETLDALAREKAEQDAAIEEGKQFLAEKGYDLETLWTQVVCWGDHDQFQHVNNVHYLRWFESGRMSWAARLAAKLPEDKAKDIVRGTGKSFILAGANIRYKIPVTYPDTLLIAQAVLLPLNEAKDRFMLRGAAYSTKRKAIVCTADQDCVSYDYNALKKCSLEPDLLKLIEARGITDWK